MQTAMATHLRRQRETNPTFCEKKEKDANTVINELKTKMSRLKFRLLDCQNQNQMLRKEMLLARKVVNTQLPDSSNENFINVLNQASTSEFRGRREKILLLQNKLIELQNRIKELEEGKPDGPSEEPEKVPNADSHKDQRKTQSRQVMDKELQYLLENCCHLKRKLEVWKKRNVEQNKEVELLRLEHERLLEKSKEDKNVLETYQVVEKELRARQSEKLDMRSKLDMEKTRNEQLVEELAMLKDDLSMILNKINDDKVLIDAFNNQQGYLHDLLDHQKMISESDNRRYRDDLREIQMKHATNSNTLSHIEDIVEEKSLECRQLQQAVQNKMLIVDEEEEKHGDVASSVTITTESEQSQPSETQSSGPEGEQPGEEESRDTEEEIRKLNEECEQQKSLFRSMRGEVEDLSRIVFSNNQRLNEWMSQLLETRSLYAQTNAEVRDLEETANRLQSPVPPNKKHSASSKFCAHFLEELEKKNDILNEEYHFLLTLKQLLMFPKENSLEVLATSIDFMKKQFADAIPNLLSNNQPETEEQQKSDVEAAE